VTTRLPICSALFKQRTDGLVVTWATTSYSKYPLLNVFIFFSYPVSACIEAVAMVAFLSSIVMLQLFEHGALCVVFISEESECIEKVYVSPSTTQLETRGITFFHDDVLEEEITTL
jgi:hypothetical protein